MSSPDTNNPTFCFDDNRFYWQMSRWEKYALSMLVKAHRAEVAIEVGTCGGGSLQLLAANAQKVYSVDIDPECERKLGSFYENVEFVVGDSRMVLPELVVKLHAEEQKVGFVLIDGDHTAEGVAADIGQFLRFRPMCDLVVVMHDSFNPECREGILAADWVSCPFVHYIEIDFVPGAFHANGFSEAKARSMWGGFAVARLKTVPRTSELLISESQRAAFDIIRAESCHADSTRVYDVGR